MTHIFFDGRVPEKEEDFALLDLTMAGSAGVDTGGVGRTNPGTRGYFGFDYASRHLEPDFAGEGGLVYGARCGATPETGL